MARPNVLRARVVKIVAERPGLCIRELLSALGSQSGASHRAIMTSEAQGLIVIDRSDHTVKRGGKTGRKFKVQLCETL
jgi:hypothetical protein